MTKTHFAVDPANSTEVACGRTVRENAMTPFTQRVTCNSCISRNSFQEEHQKFMLRKEQAFLAQTPRTFREPWREGVIECRECGGKEFRMGDRTCYGHYDNYHCSGCGHVESRMTEIGRSF